ncbi:helix-turn-helix domain-containing protein [Sphingosinicella sp.]|uniref:helix-turn-helix transcriptional regulator n=1 Tax=Sphingosinicella sp. TaxID=1917971 RepID=UPI00262C0F15|nr:helix-turn-helix domain-containing protein [Sphingosinicella sp.]
MSYLRTPAAAKYISVGKSTLERWRTEETGPKFRVLGKKIVVYAVSDLDEWASQQVFAPAAERAAV